MWVNLQIYLGVLGTIAIHVFALWFCWFVACGCPECFCWGASLLYGVMANHHITNFSPNKLKD
jgi:hypothetical protein